MPLGDLLLTTPFLRALRNLYPNSHIDLLADERWGDIVRLNPCIDEFIALNKARDHSNYWKQACFIRKIRARKYDTVINLHYNERSSAIAVFSGAKVRMGYANKYFAPLLDMYQPNRCLIKHIVESHYDILREKLCIDNAAIHDNGLELYTTQESEALTERIWQDKWQGKPPERVVGLNIGASWPTKRWPVEYFAQLAVKFMNDGYAIAFFGSAPERELVEQCVCEINTLAQNSQLPIAVLTGELTLMQLAVALRKCAVLVTNDTGPLHIAVSQRVPTISFYGPSPVPGFAPYNNYSVVLKSALDCHPCRKWQCPLGSLKCMYNIKPEIVYERAKELMAQVAAGRTLSIGACSAEIYEY